MDTNIRYKSSFLLTVFLSITTGCTSTRTLMPTPEIYLGPNAEELFTTTPQERQTTDVELLYITNRHIVTNPKKNPSYGEGRSLSLAFGLAHVKMVPNLDWLTLKQQSHLAKRTSEINLELGNVQELGRFPEEPYALVKTDSGVARTIATLKEHEKTRTSFEIELRKQLKRSPTKNVLFYIHGFNETFASAAYTTAELCHFFGREDVCTFFTWPASSTGNFLTSYATTTESAEFSVGHLRKAIRMIAQTPGIEGIQLLAHSRGSMVLLSALKELLIESLAYGIAPAEYIKLINVILMAPDIDADVARQKLEIFSSDPDMISHISSQQMPDILKGRITIYSSPGDKALYAAKILFRSRSRVGGISMEQISQEDQERLANWDKIDLIVYKGKRTDQFGHTYFTSNPRISSDLIQLVRYGRKPAAPGRALQQVGPIVWTFPDD